MDGVVAEHELRRRGLHGRVVHELGGRIVGGAMAPGEALPTEEELGPELGVSRSVLREAIKVLAGKGLVDVRPKIGTRVRPRRSWHLLDPEVIRWQFERLPADDDLLELSEVRAVVEPSAARLAACRRTDADLADIEAHCKRMDSAVAEPMAYRTAELDFHAAVVDASHNMLLSHMGAVIRVALSSVPSDGEVSVLHGTAGHRSVLDAIDRHDAEVAEKGMRELIDRQRPTTAKEK